MCKSQQFGAFSIAIRTMALVGGGSTTVKQRRGGGISDFMPQDSIRYLVSRESRQLTYGPRLEESVANLTNLFFVPGEKG